MTDPSSNQTQISFSCTAHARFQPADGHGAGLVTEDRLDALHVKMLMLTRLCFDWLMMIPCLVFLLFFAVDAATEEAQGYNKILMAKYSIIQHA